MEHNGLYVGRGVSATLSPPFYSSRRGFATSIPACLENLRDIRRTLPCLYVRLLRRYHSQFDHHIRADRCNFKSANECGRGQADRHLRSYSLVPAKFASWESSAARPGFASGCNSYDILQCTTTAENLVHDPLNLSMPLWLLLFVLINQKTFPHWGFVPYNISMTMIS